MLLGHPVLASSNGIALSMLKVADFFLFFLPAAFSGLSVAHTEGREYMIQVGFCINMHTDTREQYTFEILYSKKWQL